MPRTTHVLKTFAVAPDGQQAMLRDTVRTGKPTRLLRASISSNARTVGVGRPIVVAFTTRSAAGRTSRQQGP